MCIAAFSRHLDTLNGAISQSQSTGTTPRANDDHGHCYSQTWTLNVGRRELKVQKSLLFHVRVR